MALIKCPSCDQTVLSIASVCPKCGHMLMQNPHAQGGTGEFVECPRCNKFIPQDADRCGFCGYPRRARRRLWMAVGAVTLVAAVTGGVIGARQLLEEGGQAPQSTPRQVAESAGPSPTSAVRPLPDSSVEVQEPASTNPIVVSQPEPQTRPASEAPAADTTPIVRSQPAAILPRVPSTVPSTVNRWASTWANLREGPGTDYPVIRVLEPGERIRVASLTRGFWAVYDDGTIEGYVANSVLSDRQLPPDSLRAGANGPVR